MLFLIQNLQIHQNFSNNKCWHLILNTEGCSCKSLNKSSFSLDQRFACKRHKKVFFYFRLIPNDTNNLIILPFSFPKLAFCSPRLAQKHLSSLEVVGEKIMKKTEKSLIICCASKSAKQQRRKKNIFESKGNGERELGP